MLYGHGKGQNYAGRPRRTGFLLKLEGGGKG